MARDHLAHRLSFDHLFRTKRLLFRALENTSEHTAFIRDIMVEDPATYAQSTNRLLAPLTADEVESDVAGLVKSALLAVVICLQPSSSPPPRRPLTDEDEEEENKDAQEEEEGDGDQDSTRWSRSRSSKTTREEEEEAAAEEELPPTAIGWLTLSCPALTLHHRSCTLGIMIGSAHQGRGYGTEAINWALDWAFRVAAMHAVRLSCFSFNAGAARLYRRLGFVREGVTREAYYYDCAWYDRVSFSMLDREWAAIRGLGVVGG